jgi:regulator of sigma E protease
MILTIIIAFFSLIILVTLHEFGHFILAKKFGVKVEEFGIGYPPRIFGKKIGETVYSLNLLPFGAFVKIHGEEGGIEDYQSFVGKAIWQRVLIVLGGVVAFWVVAAVLFTVVFAIGAEIPVPDDTGSTPVEARVIIAEVSPGSPAETSGLKIGDTILNAAWQSENIKISKMKDFQDFVVSHKGQEITLTVKRDGKVFDTATNPRLDPPAGQGSLGVGLQRMAVIIQKQAWYRAPVQGVIYCGQLTTTALKGLAKIFIDLFGGKGVPAEATPAGPIGITVFLAKAVSFGPGFFLYFVGAIAVLVAISNLLPIPALDGGKLIFLLIEGIRKRPVSAKVEQNITMTFFVLLIVFSIIITIKFDIPRLSDFIKSGS